METNNKLREALEAISCIDTRGLKRLLCELVEADIFDGGLINKTISAIEKATRILSAPAMEKERPMEANNTKKMREALESFIHGYIEGKICAPGNYPSTEDLEYLHSGVKKAEDALAAPPRNCPTMKLTLDEAIDHAESCADDTPCGQNHRQLADWLKELKESRNHNAAKLRKALSSLIPVAEHGLSARTHLLNSTVGVTTVEEAARALVEQAKEALTKARAALASPSRQSDFGTAEVQGSVRANPKGRRT